MNETPSLQALRSFLTDRAPTVRAGTVDPLRSILCVGGQGTPHGLRGNDKSFFEVAIPYLAESEVPVDPDFRIEICNLDPAYGGKDFLEYDAQIDLILFMFLLSPEPKDVGYFSLRERFLPTTVSPHHAPGAFREAIRRTDARAIMFRASGNEVDEGFILSQTGVDRADFPYDAMTSTSEHIMTLCGWDNGSLSRVFRSRLSIPGGILLRRDWLAALSKSLPIESSDKDYGTLLHKRLAEWSPG